VQVLNDCHKHDRKDPVSRCLRTSFYLRRSNDRGPGEKWDLLTSDLFQEEPLGKP